MDSQVHSPEPDDDVGAPGVAPEMLERARRKTVEAAQRYGGDPSLTEAPDWVPPPSAYGLPDEIQFRGDEVRFVRLTTAPKFDGGALDAALLGSARQRGRERRPKSRASRSTRATRAGPSDEPDLAALSPLQAGWLSFLNGLVAASEGGERSYVNLLDLIAIRVARELAQYTDWGEQA